MLVAHGETVLAPVPALTVWFAPFVNDGGSLMGFTVMVNVCAALVVTRML